MVMGNSLHLTISLEIDFNGTLQVNERKWIFSSFASLLFFSSSSHSPFIRCYSASDNTRVSHITSAIHLTIIASIDGVASSFPLDFRMLVKWSNQMGNYYVHMHIHIFYMSGSSCTTNIYLLIQFSKM